MERRGRLSQCPTSLAAGRDSRIAWARRYACTVIVELFGFVCQNGGLGSFCQNGGLGLFCQNAAPASCFWPSKAATVADGMVPFGKDAKWPFQPDPVLAKQSQRVAWSVGTGQ
jgi:hypothetical protein